MEQDKIVEQMLREAEAAAEPGTSKVGEILHRGDEDMPAPMMMRSVESAGHVYIYDTKSGDRSLCNRNMLLHHLKKQRSDGSPIFSVHKPDIVVTKVAYKCLLHKDDPNRAHYDELGFAVCPKSNLSSPFQVTRHMVKRHKMEWQSIQHEKAEREKEEQREFQRDLLSKVGESAPVRVKGKVKK